MNYYQDMEKLDSIQEKEIDLMVGTVRVKVPDLLAQRNMSTPDLMFGARLAAATAYRLADGDAERISFDVLARLCAFFNVGIGEILEYVPPPQDQG
jgi:DNA-binding Xre family transcriptional regulator